MGALARVLSFCALLVGFLDIAQARQIVVRPALFCDTQEQVLRILNADDKDAEVSLVNTETSNACAVMSIAFFIGDEVGRVVNGKTYRIMEIAIVSIDMGIGWIQFPPFKQFTAFEAESEGA